ncbi:MAG: cytochrome c peroxidase [Chitinophagaceae bacterium]
MRKLVFTIILCFVVLVSISYTKKSLRDIYSRPSSQWPSPTIDKGVKWKELGILPASPLENKKDSLKDIIELGKTLFFDTRLSGSGKISCATCHNPELNWTDGKEKSIGHEGTINKRNSPTIQNTWFYEKLFWDGRSSSLEDQAFAPINSESEMHHEMPELVRLLRNIKGYSVLFDKAFGSTAINPQSMTEAIATFERTIVSNKSRFDDFLSGKRNALSNSELRGLHIFRTKARCMNCHNGPLFTDNQFHNIGFSQNDNGYYQVTHKDEDVGKFKTPSLRDVMKTGPWMHNGKSTSMEEIIEKLNSADLPTNNNALIKPLNLSKKEKNDILAFLKAISASQVEFKKPVILE